MKPHLDEDAVAAIADLVERTGATEFKIGYLHDDVPVEQAGWHAYAQYKGARITVDNQRGPTEAANALARRLLTDAQCKCDRKSTLDVPAPGRCTWYRSGDHWYSGCDEVPEGAMPPAAPIPAEAGDDLHSTEKLARALEELGDPALRTLIYRARSGYYHDFLSPLPVPEMQLVTDLRQLGHEAVAKRVADDEFTASRAETDAWSRSPEGRATFQELVDSGRRSGGNRSDRRKRKKRRR